MPTDFAATKRRFALPAGVTYLDGNSLGPLPRAAAARIARTVTDEWGQMLITGWNKAGWMDQPMQMGNRIARLIGAESGHVVLGDTLSIKVYQALSAALDLNPKRKVILSDTGNFPSDLYMAEGLCRTLGNGYILKTVAPEDLPEAIDDSTAVTLITEVDYRTGRKHDMATITQRAHHHGALTIWDLAHSAGALPVHLAAVQADFAVGCTYKYLNAGPGAPAFIYAAPRHAHRINPALAGWLGHEAPFAFAPHYTPGTSVERLRVGTPAILQLAALDAALDIWDTIDLTDLRTTSLALTDQFIAGVESTCPSLTLATPRAHNERGSQVSFRHPHGFAIMQALIAHGVIGDFRAPDTLRFGFTPLFIDQTDVAHAIQTLKTIMANDLWTRPDYQTRPKVT